MEFLKSQLEQIRRHVGQLSTSAKMAALLLAIVVALSLAWMISAASSPDRVAVFDAALTGEELIRAEHVIRGQGIDVEVSNGLLMVSKDQKDGAFMALVAEEISTPAGSTDLLQQALTASPFTTKDQSDRVWAHWEQTRLSQLISLFPTVKRAQVVLKQGSPGGIGSRQVAPTASVHLVMKGNQRTSPKMRRAIADLICGGVTGLSRSDVRIVDSTNGRSFICGDEGGNDDEELEAIKQWEDHYVTNIRAALGDIPDVLVSVFAVPDTTQSVKTDSVEYDDPVSSKVNSVSESMANANGRAKEPGVMPNAPGRLPTVETGGGSSSERSESTMDARYPTIRTTKVEGPSVGLKEVSASVGVPLSYLVRIFQKMRGDDSSEPSEVELQTLLAQVRDRVRPTLPIKDDGQIHVAWYLDAEPAPAGEAVKAGVIPAITTHGTSVALGTLAVLALGMVMMFARRRAPEPPNFENRFTPEGLLDTTVGAVDGSEGALEGIELDDDMIRSQRVVDQVGEMVRERPDSAANLVRRWIEQG